MTLVYCWLALNAGFALGVWWANRRWLRRIDELSRGIIGDAWRKGP